jgi:hypothetical protein
MLFTLIALALQQDAEATFKSFEKKFVEGKSLDVKFKLEVKEPGKDETGGIEGRMRTKPGEKFTLDLKILAPNQPARELNAKSDGKRSVSSNDGKADEEETKAGTAKLMSSALTRAGISLMFLLMRGHGKEQAVPTPDDVMRVSNFKLGEDGKDRLLEYTLTVKELGDLPVKLWLTEDLVPKKRVVVISKNGKESTFTETYEGVSTDEIPDAAFEHQK